jgi:hypothetical protein
MKGVGDSEGGEKEMMVHDKMLRGPPIGSGRQEFDKSMTIGTGRREETSVQNERTSNWDLKLIY